MAKLIEVKTGELAIGVKDDIIKTGSIGSCLVIVLYDGVNRIGGLAHAMLPKGEGSQNEEKVDFEPNNNSGKYVKESIDNLIFGIRKQGGQRENLYARLVGGASMFKRLTGDKFGIGYQNIMMGRDFLKQLKIPIENEDTGGSSGKTVEFDIKTGLVSVNTII